MINGFYTDAERADPYTDICDGFVFTCRTDLSGPIIVTTKYSVGDLNMPKTLTNYTQALSSFIGMWTARILPHLNGFSGFGRLDFRLEFCYPVVEFCLDSDNDTVIKFKEYIAGSFQENMDKKYRVRWQSGEKTRYYDSLMEAKEYVVKKYQDSYGEQIKVIGYEI